MLTLKLTLEDTQAGILTADPVEVRIVLDDKNRGRLRALLDHCEEKPETALGRAVGRQEGSS